MHEQRDLALVWELDLNQMWLMRIKRHINFTRTFPGWSYWLGLWSLCLWIL